jgi:molecular chaperone GrpE
VLDHFEPEDRVDEPLRLSVEVLQSHRKLLALLESDEVRAYDSIGAAFDPREHEAVAQRTESGKPAGEVLEEHRKGWRIRDRVLRPAVVSVATD